MSVLKHMQIGGLSSSRQIFLGLLFFFEINFSSASWAYIALTELLFRTVLARHTAAACT